MKRFIAIGFVAGLLFAVRSGFAQAPAIVSFDENAKGTILGPTLPGSPLPVTPSMPPVYHLAGVLGFVPTPGDVLVTEGNAASQVGSDLLRFDQHGDLTVFSDIETTDKLDLADVGIPSPTPFATVTKFETDPAGGPPIEGGINGLFGYAPAPGTPGSGPAAGLVVYNFTSDVPEPASLSVIGIGACALLARRDRRTA